MDDYISREAIKKVKLAFYKAYRQNNKEERLVALIELGSALNKIPAADVRPVVYCKDCKNYDTACCGDGFGWCDEFNQGMLDDGFCCFGERREGGTP